MGRWVAQFYLAAVLAVGAPAYSQDATPGAAAPAGEFFSGTVVSFSATEITVSRKGLGKETSAVKTFSIDQNTRVEGMLKPKAHVTVRFMPADSSRAVHIIVR